MHRLDLAKSLFTANPSTGVISWAGNPDARLFSTQGNYLRHLRDRAGKRAKLYAAPSGHLSLKVRHEGKNVTLLAHRIVWALAYDEYPDCDLDHINNDPSDNRLSNLRLATRSENAVNARRIKPGLKGAYPSPDGGWTSSVWDGATLRHLGAFSTPEEAHAAWAKAKSPLSGAFFNPGYASVFD